MKKLLLMSLLCIGLTSKIHAASSNKSVALEEENSYETIAKYPALAEMCEKADATKQPAVKEFIGTAMFGESWKNALKIAQRTESSRPPVPVFAFSLIYRRIETQAEESKREDVLTFMRDHFESKFFQFYARSF